MTSNRRALLGGAAAGAAACLATAAMIGMAEQQPVSGGRWVTSSNDGRTAYLWESTGNQLRYVATAHAPKGRDEADGDKPEDKTKAPKEKDKGEGPGRGRGG